MRIGIVGAGSIGSFLGARLARQGAEVTLVARGATLRALQGNGLTLIERDGSRSTHRLRAVGSPAEAGTQDVVLLATKAHQVAPIAPQLAALFHAETVVVTLQNGIPWWYFHGRPGPYAGKPVRTVDPAGDIAASIPVSRVLGCVVYPACDMPSPGVVRHVEGERFPLGELDGAVSPRALHIGALLEAAGLKAPVLQDIRSEIWLKLWGNLCFNPISALSRATLADICAEPATRRLAAQMMEEARSVGERLGAEFRVSIERRIEGAAKVGAHRTSMLQDIEAGRPTEVDALLGSVIELARWTQTPVPRLEAVHACMTLLERSACRPPEAAAATQVPLGTAA